MAEQPPQWPPGWYTDPEYPDRQRYWDGQQWAKPPSRTPFPWWLVVIVIVMALGVVVSVFDDSGDETAVTEPSAPPVTEPTETPEAASECLPVPAPLRESLQDSLKPGRRLSKVAAVRSEAQVDLGPRDLTAGLYFVSGDVQPSPGVTTWAAGERAFTTGGGIIVGVGPAARAVSDAGVDIPSSTLESWGLTEATEGYQESQDCLGRAPS